MNPLDSELQHIGDLTGQGRHTDALAALAVLSLKQPDCRDLLHLQAVNLRHTGRIDDALAVLHTLERRHPRCSRLYEERGQCLAARGSIQAAIDALVQGLTLNPALPTSWDLLAHLYRAQGDAAAAAAAARQLALLKQLPREVAQASSLIAEGDLAPADSVLRAYLRKDAHNVGVLRMLARIELERGALDEAAALLLRVLEFAPDFDAARLDHAMVLLRQHRYRQAREEAAILLEREPNRREYLKLYGAACIGLGDHEPLIALYEKLLTGATASATEISDLRLWRGNALKTTGRHEEAVAEYRAALAARPDSGVVWFSLANLKTYRFTDDDVTRMQALESSPATLDADRAYLCFALGKALEDHADYASSWHYYVRGNALKRAGGRHRPEIPHQDARLQIQHYTPEFFAARPGWGNPSRAPIFVLGMPRAGSTLIEQILASHSQVEGTQELNEIESYAAELGGGASASGALHPDALQRLGDGDFRRLGDRFLEDTRIYRSLGRPFFIDKMPDNFWHIALIHLMLPNATIIDARREPMACCMGNLKQLFGPQRQEFAYGIDDVARQYRTYLEVMRHWSAVLPGRILTVLHEDVVADLEGSVRRILEHCRLPFEPACLRFHETRRSVRSASSEQVRRPISPEAVDSWRHYEPWLGPLRDALGDALVRYRN